MKKISLELIALPYDFYIEEIQTEYFQNNIQDSLMSLEFKFQLKGLIYIMIYKSCTESAFLKKIKGKPLIIFGASGAAKKIIWNYKLIDQILFFIDNDPEKRNTFFEVESKKFKIYTPDIFKQIDIQKNLVLIIASSYGHEIAAQLNEIPQLDNMEYYMPLFFEEESYSDINKPDYQKISTKEYKGAVDVMHSRFPEKVFPIYMEHLLQHKSSYGCCGCAVCMAVCPANCITMVYDEEGFRYPRINYSSCAGCGKCIQACPSTYDNANQLRKSYAAYYNDVNVLKKSSSGGIFTALADYILSENGIVYGAKYQKEKNEVIHTCAETKEDYEAFRGSKYLQSDISPSYFKVEQDLKSGRKVLFTGTPCQIAALYNFLGKDYEHLYTVDLLCHGVPSQKVFERFVEECEEIAGAKLSDIAWRDKTYGWNPIKMTMRFSNHLNYTANSQENLFSRGFNDNLYLRPSCYDCTYNQLPRIGDLTLGDYWGYDGNLKEQNPNGGISLVIVSSEKGKFLFEQISPNLCYEAADLEHAFLKNRPIKTHSSYNYLRNQFFTDFINNMSFSDLCRKYFNLELEDIKNKLT